MSVSARPSMFRRPSVAIVAMMLAAGIAVGAWFLVPRWTTHTSSAMVMVQGAMQAGGDWQAAPETDRWLVTLADIIRSDDVLNGIAEDRRLGSELPEWLADNGGNDMHRVRESLKRALDVRAEPGTYLLKLTACAPRAADSAKLLGLYEERIQAQLMRMIRTATSSAREAQLTVIDSYRLEIDELRSKRRKLMIDRNLTGVDPANDDAAQAAEVVRDRMLDVRVELEQARAASKAAEEQLQNPEGVQYDGEIWARAEMDPIVRDVHEHLIALKLAAAPTTWEAEGAESLETGRSVASVSGLLESTRADTLDRIFRADLDRTRAKITSLEAVEAELSNRENSLVERCRENAKTFAELKDIDRRVTDLMTLRSAAEEKLHEMNARHSSISDGVIFHPR